MAQRNLIFQPATQDNCYPQLPQVEQELGYPTFISSDVNQVMPQTPNYTYEHVHRLQQPALPFYPMENTQPYCIPVQSAYRYQPSRLIQRKNRNIPFQYQDAKRLRIDGQPSPIQPYQTNIDMQTQQQIFYQQMSQTSIAKYPLDTQSPTNSSPSRSPILNTSVSPSNTRDPFEEVKCFHHRHQPITPAPISQTCYRPANRYGNLSPQSSFAPLQVPAESTTSSPLLNERDEGETTSDFINTRQQPTEELETILIQDEDDVNPLESEIVIVSVKSPTVPPLEQTASPLISSPHTPIEEPEIPYQPYPQRGLPLQQPHLQPAHISAGFPVHNNILDQNHFFTQDFEYPYHYPVNNIPCTAPIQAYFTTDQHYTIPMYPRPGTPTPFSCPQPILNRGPLPRRMTRPHDYVYVPTITPTLREYTPFEEHQGFILHHMSHPHTPTRPKKQGLTKAELKKLKVRKYKLAESKDIDESCVICMDEYKDGDKLYVLSCNHEYHRDCVKDWLVKQRNCPLCRKEVIP